MNLLNRRTRLFVYAAFVAALAVWQGSSLADPTGHTAKTRPVKMGTSGGSIANIDGNWCCGGTLGALVEKNGTQYILSNNHVLARFNRFFEGEGVVQPGLIDTDYLGGGFCQQIPGDVVASLSEYIEIKQSTSGTAQPYLASEEEAAKHYKGTLENLHKIGSLGALAWCFSDYDESLWGKPPLESVFMKGSSGLLERMGQ